VNLAAEVFLVAEELQVLRVVFEVGLQALCDMKSEMWNTENKCEM
jgi:hypothetical protein